MSVFRLLALARRGVLILDELLQDGLFDPPDVLTSHLDGRKLAGGNEGAGGRHREIQGLGDVSESEESCCHGNMLSVGVASFDWFESAIFYASFRESDRLVLMNSGQPTAFSVEHAS